MRLPALLSLVALAACASISPEARLRAGLMEAGLGLRQSACMAERMADKLSLLQLRRMSSLKNLRGDRARGMSVDRLLYNLRSLEDPEIIAVTSSAALRCAIGG